jgi:hypothetical protein
MNEYEGLNLPELLALMHEIVLPEPISRMPEGPGWWILLAWLVAVGAAFARYLLLRRRANAYRRDAITLLRAIASNKNVSGSKAAEQIAVLVKRTALAAYPRETIASLYGADWAHFLRETAGNDPVVNSAADELAGAAYHGGVDGADLVAPARRWIRVHRA